MSDTTVPVVPVVSSSSLEIAPPTPAAPRSTANWVRPVVAGAFVLMLGAGGLWAGKRISAAQAQAADRTHFAPGVTVANLPVGKLTRQEAEPKLRQWAQQKNAALVTLTAPVSGKRWNITVADAGGRYDTQTALDQALKIGKDETWWQYLRYGEQERNVNIEPAFRLNPDALTRQVARIAPRVNRAPQNARARITDGGQVTVASRERKGVALDVKATVAGVTAHGLPALQNGITAPLVIREKPPLVTSADLGKMGTVLGSFTSDYSSSTSERARNVELAANFINGTVLAPGEVFSYNKIVGPRTSERGWQNALMFEDGAVVPGVGGGVCQPSSTLYNAVLGSGLEVVSRSNHSIRVHYVPLGRDATVVYGAIDFKFRNSTPGPVVVLSRAKGRRLTFSIYGKAPENPRRYEIVTGPVRDNQYGGLTVTTYRVIHEADGTTRREYLTTDTYHAPGASSGTASRSRPRRRPSA